MLFSTRTISGHLQITLCKHVQQTGIEVYVRKKQIIHLLFQTEQRCASWRGKSCKWPRKLVWFYLCIYNSHINRVFVNFLDLHGHKQIIWKKDGNRRNVPLCSPVFNNNNNKTSVCMCMQECDANLLVNSKQYKLLKNMKRAFCQTVTEVWQVLPVCSNLGVCNLQLRGCMCLIRPKSFFILIVQK